MPRLDKKTADKVRKLLEKDLKNSEIAKICECSPKQVANVKAGVGVPAQAGEVLDITKEVDKFDSRLINIYKNLSIAIGNTITYKDIKRASLSQRLTSLAIATDKLRLLEGKSTANISAKIVGSLEPEQMEILQDLGQRLIKSMLTRERD